MVPKANFLRRLTLPATGLLILFLSLGGAQAHITDTTSASVILRSGQVEIHILTNAQHWQAALADPEAWLLGDTDSLMPPNLDSEQQQRFLRQLVTVQTLVQINGRKLSFDRVSLTRPAGSEDMEIVLFARHSFQQVENLLVRFPDSLGSVHLSVVQPEYRVLSAGETAELSL
ncbi:hypothetical protein OQJ46_07945 [Microbulbifer thermotolerans]|uniref:hypothetical protein n=1 Tax=Microbulbifer thermotolerans TaxID=252514 RepID=UPI002248AF00|nr:hypothetical protein [Microbulbifer thermotolerans]MCX2778527.1 hypothetical protein [Microbulbifer thermotolerans]MCX2782919.1 hypothetical protein [Microbulbifer thermotolerans]MCX2794010.1 hypothetical protein [Microbulbifer thermotolerans]MCX2803964.1 hypothetical protein [Microbulbifer thermotolerans]MCX2830792.1 hypothetical protein [Microbulbifer thermotolerans]